MSVCILKLFNQIAARIRIFPIPLNSEREKKKHDIGPKPSTSECIRMQSSRRATILPFI